MDVVDNGAKTWVNLHWLFRQKEQCYLLQSCLLQYTSDIFIRVLTPSDIYLFTTEKIFEYPFYFEVNSAHPNNMKNVMITNTLPK